MIIASDLDRQGHTEVRLKLSFNLPNISNNISLSYYIQTCSISDGRLADALYMPMLVSMTLTLMQGHSGSASRQPHSVFGVPPSSSLVIDVCHSRESPLTQTRTLYRPSYEQVSFVFSFVHAVQSARHTEEVGLRQ